MGNPDIKDDKKYWLDDEKNVKKLLYVFYALCALVFLADFFYEKYLHFPPENIPNFYGFWGLLSFVFIVFAGKALRKLVMRDEDYYDR